jgi:hypothetical protein
VADRIAAGTGSDTAAAPSPGVSDAVIPGDVVRDLVARNEREIDELLALLEQALHEAEEAESRAGDSVVAVRGANGSTSRLGAGATGPVVPRRTTTGGAPRTTVDARDRSAPSASTPHIERGHAPTPAGSKTSWFTSHWVWRSGVALTVLALVLLKFG